MSKLGKEFQVVVADVVRQMDPNANVREGQWVKGPDGARDLDVVIEGAVNGIMRRIQVECKDYGKRRRRVGIGAIDALESKHRDLKMDVSLMCCNNGFSDNAVRKAKRVGIGLIGVLRKDDPRIRYRVFDEFYTRVITDVPMAAMNVTFQWSGAARPPPDTNLGDFAYGGIPISNWLLHRIEIFLGSNLVVNGAHSLTFRFKRPVDLAIPSGTVSTSSIKCDFKFTGWWLAKRVEIDATSGLYDWIRHAVEPGAGACTVHYKGVPIGHQDGSAGPGSKIIRCPPNLKAINPLTFTGNGAGVSALVLTRTYKEPKPIPQLDPLVVDEDLVYLRHDIPANCYYSQRSKGNRR